MRVAGVDLSAHLQLHSLRAGHPAATCSACRRRLLPGEILHVYDQHRSLCTLCAAGLPDAERAPLRSERIRADLECPAGEAGRSAHSHLRAA